MLSPCPIPNSCGADAAYSFNFNAFGHFAVRTRARGNLWCAADTASRFRRSIDTHTTYNACRSPPHWFLLGMPIVWQQPTDKVWRTLLMHISIEMGMLLVTYSFGYRKSETSQCIWKIGQVALMWKARARERHWLSRWEDANALSRSMCGCAIIYAIEKMGRVNTICIYVIAEHISANRSSLS